VVNAITRSPEQLRHIGQAARERVLSAHTAQHRSHELLQLIEEAA